MRDLHVGGLLLAEPGGARDVVGRGDGADVGERGGVGAAEEAVDGARAEGGVRGVVREERDGLGVDDELRAELERREADGADGGAVVAREERVERRGPAGVHVERDDVAEDGARRAPALGAAEAAREAADGDERVRRVALARVERGHDLLGRLEPDVLHAERARVVVVRADAPRDVALDLGQRAADVVRDVAPARALVDRARAQPQRAVRKHAPERRAVVREHAARHRGPLVRERRAVAHALLRRDPVPVQDAVDRPVRNRVHQRDVKGLCTVCVCGCVWVC